MDAANSAADQTELIGATLDDFTITQTQNRPQASQHKAFSLAVELVCYPAGDGHLERVVMRDLQAKHQSVSFTAAETEQGNLLYGLARLVQRLRSRAMTEVPGQDVVVHPTRLTQS